MSPKKNDIVEVLCNPISGVKSTMRYISQPAQVMIVLCDAVLLMFYDGKEFIVGNECVKVI